MTLLSRIIRSDFGELERELGGINGFGNVFGPDEASIEKSAVHNTDCLFGRSHFSKSQIDIALYEKDPVKRVN